MTAFPFPVAEAFQLPGIARICLQWRVRTGLTPVSLFTGGSPPTPTATILKSMLTLIFHMSRLFCLFFCLLSVFNQFYLLSTSFFYPRLSFTLVFLLPSSFALPCLFMCLDIIRYRFCADFHVNSSCFIYLIHTNQQLLPIYLIIFPDSIFLWYNFHLGYWFTTRS